MFKFFNPKTNRAIAGIVIVVMLVSVVLTALVSFVG